MLREHPQARPLSDPRGLVIVEPGQVVDDVGAAAGDQDLVMRPKERGPIEGTIFGATRASADGFDQRAIQSGRHDSVMIGICDKEAVILFVSDNFAGERQRQIANLGFLQYQFQRSFIQLAPLPEFGNYFRVDNRFWKKPRNWQRASTS